MGDMRYERTMIAKPDVDEFCPVVEMTKEELEREVAQYAYDRRLSPEDLGKLAQEMIDETDPRKQTELCEALMRGFYGGIVDA